MANVNAAEQETADLAALVEKAVAKAMEGKLARLLEEAARPAPEYITMHEAARLTNFGYHFIRDQVQAGYLPAVKKGRDWRVKVADLRAWMDRDRGGKPAPAKSEMQSKVSRYLPGL